MTELRLLPDEEAAQFDPFREQSLAEYEEHKRLVEACGEHDWELLLELDDDIGGSAQLQCTRCPADVDDVMPDGWEFIYLETEEGVEVEAGRHKLTEPAVVPVTVNVWSSRCWTDWGWEYDAGLDIEQRGPVRYLGGVA